MTSDALELAKESGVGKCFNTGDHLIQVFNSPLKMSVSVSALRQDNDCQTDRHIAGQRRYQQHSQATGG